MIQKLAGLQNLHPQINEFQIALERNSNGQG
jgi:hypothetical protein